MTQSKMYLLNLRDAALLLGIATVGNLISLLLFGGAAWLLVAGLGTVLETTDPIRSAWTAAKWTGGASYVLCYVVTLFRMWPRWMDQVSGRHAQFWREQTERFASQPVWNPADGADSVGSGRDELSTVKAERKDQR